MVLQVIWNTREVAGMLGLSTQNLNQKIWRGQIPAPEKGPGGSYLWTTLDIANAYEALSRLPQRTKHELAIA
ncbi:MAG: hypothetical protein CEE38_08470 [Planctomycetes bacterium B3_Pla]|nr:MAG: hypothetical protein CEE38_08470 [Planctomycetes bacterium B3_Pla]